MGRTVRGNITTDNYDRTSRIYDVSRYAIPEKVGKLVRCLGLSAVSIVLDLGCGTGNFTKALSPRARSIVGIDLSEGMLAKARSKEPEGQSSTGCARG